MPVEAKFWAEVLSNTYGSHCTSITVDTPWLNHGFISTLRAKLWNPVSSEKRMGFRKLAHVSGCTPKPTPLHDFVQFLGCEPPRTPHPAKTCLLSWIYPGMGYVMHFITPPLFTDLHTFYALFIRTQFKKQWAFPAPLGPALLTLRSHLYCCNYAETDKATHASQTLHSFRIFRCMHLELLKKKGLRVIK